MTQVYLVIHFHRPDYYVEEEVLSVHESEEGAEKRVKELCKENGVSDAWHKSSFDDEWFDVAVKDLMP